MKTRLHAVPSPADEPLDISALIRADVQARDWASVHVNGDRGPAISLGQRIRRVWR